MKLLTAILLSAISSVALAAGGTPAPLCPKNAPSTCVVPNWGMVNPDNVHSLLTNPSIASSGDRPAVAPLEVRRLSVAMSRGPVGSDDATIRTVVSPRNLYEVNTTRLTAAIQRARFNEDGSIASGGDAIAAAAERLVKQAGGKYQLTLYVRVSETLAPDESGSLDKKLETLNGLLSGSGRRATSSDTRG